MPDEGQWMEAILEFLRLDDRDQFIYLSKNGVYLMNKDTDTYVRSLYSCKDFFVEVAYIRSDAHCVSIQVFRDIEFLEPYLDSIALNFRQ